jgi:Eco29kI restriction endonuclease
MSPAAPGDEGPYNPLDKKNLGASVAEALLGRKPRALGQLGTFVGAGIYAIYYHGAFAAYERIARANLDDDPRQPIYVGKAVPEGARKGTSLGQSTRALFKRLTEHADSIRAAASTLKIEDFACRHLVVDDIWIPLGESLLIAKFQPVWNNLIDGFGNHDPGRGRHAGLRPRWDVLHPGRAWADKCQPRVETAEQIAEEVKAQLAATPMPINQNLYAEQRARALGRA